MPETSGQFLPDYRERNMLTNDSLVAALRNDGLSNQASEGSIDASEYILGPGDKIFISILGMEEIALNLMINHEGYLYIPRVGGIKVSDISLEDGRKKIAHAIDRYYKDVSVFISLIDFRKIKVSMIGDVVRPSSYILPANARLMDLLSTSSGLAPSASYRDIKITHRNRQSEYYDLVSFLRTGDKKFNPILREGDVVYVDKVDRTIRISGAVKFPGIYEYRENETILDLIKLAGGLYHSARTDTIEVVRFDDDGIKQYSLFFPMERVKNENLYLNNKDMVIVRELPDYLIERYVLVEGLVKYPGYYKIIKGETFLSEIIEQAGGFRTTASLQDATVSRTTGISTFDPEYERLKLMQRQDMTDDEYDYLKAKSRQRVGRVVVDFVNLFNNMKRTEDIILRVGDVINVPEEKNYIIMLGQIVNPGNIIYQKGLTVEDYISLAGGFGWRALENDVRVIKANSGEWVDSDDVKELEPGDTIWIPENPPGPKFWDVFTTSLSVLGQVAAVIAATVAVIISTR
jgi:polysaccharide biosynthesis/export protein